jgi:hypothetical protein
VTPRNGGWTDRSCVVNRRASALDLSSKDKIMPMHSSGDELGLLLSKWKSDSAKVAITALLVESDNLEDLRASCVVVGTVTALDVTKS